MENTMDSSARMSSDKTDQKSLISSNILEENTSKKVKYILVTHGDSYVGYTLAMFISEALTKREGQLKKKHWQVRVLCDDKNKENMVNLENRGVDVKEVDYGSQQMISEQLKDHIKTVIFNPLPKHEGHFADQGKDLLDSVFHMKIKHVLMVSMFDCSQYKNEDSILGSFYMLEEHLRCNYKFGNYVVFRIPLIQQMFHFWSKMMRSKSIIGLPISDTDYLPTVNIMDVCACLCRTALSKNSMAWNSDNESSSQEQRDEDTQSMKRVYDLKSNLSCTPLMIAEAITQAFKEEGFKSSIKSAIFQDEQLEEYMKKLSENHGDDSMESFLSTIDARPTNNDATAEGSTGLLYSLKNLLYGGKTEVSKAKFDHPDEPSLYPSPSTYLTPFLIKVILEHFRYARCPYAPMVPTNDIRDLTGVNPIELAEFFMNNRHQLRYGPE